jgi:hypothetical protein
MKPKQEYKQLDGQERQTIAACFELRFPSHCDQGCRQPTALQTPHSGGAQHPTSDVGRAASSQSGWMNGWLRKTLDWLTPLEVYSQWLAKLENFPDVIQ